MKVIKSAVLLFLLVISAGCDENTLYKAYEDIEDGLWYVNKKYTFQFEVTDASQPYNLYYLVRNAQQYPYYNLYLTREMKGPDGKTVFSRLDEMYLSDQTTGKPRGSGLGDLFDHKFVFQRNFLFPGPGKYTITLTQSMRQNPLPYIMGVGLSVERTPVAVP
ncbi:gliding motility lipoprotein GldH [Salmonirosea aquatica]|uniref:Gliding motility lipoprotein GldH n=1 Tax=Salmonirosea aquatica TaxID=2654236 RepID=A0A7C9FP94_9BACT|nr:gliding motility lipoprotein GldH [Cytophagaceae bacterium SJW1-29]